MGPWVAALQVIDTTKFPNMSALVEYGESRGVTMGFYMDNCRCHELGMPTHYEQDAHLTEELGWFVAESRSSLVRLRFRSVHTLTCTHAKCFVRKARDQGRFVWEPA